MATAPTVWERLAEPFDDTDIKLRPLEVKTAKDWKKPEKKFGKYTEACKAKYAVYIDARNVEDRLDAVVGSPAWKDEYSPLPDKSMLCRLSIRDPESGEWVYKEGAGYPNSDGDDEPYKGAESDALKRAAIKWGIGRHLYSMTHYMGINLASWVECDEYGQPGKITPPPAQTPAPAVPTFTVEQKNGYTALIAAAKLTGKKAEVMKRLGDPGNGVDALAAYIALTPEARAEVERIAAGDAA